MMCLTFSNPKKNSEVNDDNLQKTLSPYRLSPTWAIESFFIEVYSLLAHRIKGLGWSLREFWECDTWTTSKLYCMELDLIDEEERQLNESKDDLEDSAEMRDLYEEMYGDAE